MCGNYIKKIKPSNVPEIFLGILSCLWGIGFMFPNIRHATSFLDQDLDKILPLEVWTVSFCGLGLMEIFFSALGNLKARRSLIYILVCVLSVMFGVMLTVSNSQDDITIIVFVAWFLIFYAALYIQLGRWVHNNG
jgi:uncharacterized membrane protein HdeD (DUF308 family)